jgi:hypothetical protein
MVPLEKIQESSTMFAHIIVFVALVVSSHAFQGMRPSVRSMTLQAKAKAEVSPVIEERLGKPSFESKRVNQAEIYDPTLTYSDLNVLNIFSYAS